MRIIRFEYRHDIYGKNPKLIPKIENPNRNLWYNKQKTTILLWLRFEILELEVRNE